MLFNNTNNSLPGCNIYFKCTNIYMTELKNENNKNMLRTTMNKRHLSILSQLNIDSDLL